MYIAEIDSTNNLLKQKYLDQEDLFTIRTDFQTAGRGQQGNGWESEKGKNLLFSALLRDWNIPVARQFVINEVVSLSIYHSVYQSLLPFVQPDKNPVILSALHIKWPNDLYYGDKKLAGILIENAWEGAFVSRSVVGIGLNVNQTIFHSSAPNPISLRQIVDVEWNVETILQRFIQSITSYKSLFTGVSAPYDTLHAEYFSKLYRSHGYYLWEERDVSLAPSMPQFSQTNRQFMAKMDAVLPSGELVLITEQQEKRTYHFKQVRYVFPS